MLPAYLKPAYTAAFSSTHPYHTYSKSTQNFLITILTALQALPPNSEYTNKKHTIWPFTLYNP